MQKVIDSGNFKMEDLIAFLRSKFKWESWQYLSVSCWNDAISKYVDISSDADLDSAFALEKNRRVLLNAQVMDVAPMQVRYPSLHQSLCRRARKWHRSNRIQRDIADFPHLNSERNKAMKSPILKFPESITFCTHLALQCI